MFVFNTCLYSLKCTVNALVSAILHYAHVCILHTVYCIVYSVHYTVYTKLYTVCCIVVHSI